jgi:hypothetical protein
MIVTLLSPFQALLKETETAENAHVDGVIGDHPEGVVDVEVTRIVSENAVNPDGLKATKIVVGALTGGADQAGESKV